MKDTATPSSSAAGEPGDEQSGREVPWLRRNGPYLMAMAAIVVFFQYKGWVSTPADYFNALKVFVGLGGMIFIHELGHFVVAKWCDVHVETFSIGFGPPLPGCCFVRGETTYMLAIIPLGGYVKMVGEGAENDEGDTDPRSYKNKSVWQRMAIISAGVIMNVMLAVACFVFVYTTKGAERIPGIIDNIDAGSPAYTVGSKSGDMIHRIGGTTASHQVEFVWYDDLQPAVMSATKGERLAIMFGMPEHWTTTEIAPRRRKEDPKPMIGIGLPQELGLLPRRAEEVRDFPFAYESAAAKAAPPFNFDDQIVACTDPDHPDQVKDLPADPRDTEGTRRDYFEFWRRMKLLAGKEVVVRVRRGEPEAAVQTTVDIKVPPAYRNTLGLRMRMGQVSGVRENSPAKEAGVQDGDIIERVEVIDASGQVLCFATSASDKEIALDPERLPFELGRWAVSKPKSRTVKLVVLRTNPLPETGNSADHKERQRISLTAEWDKDWESTWQFNKESQLGKSSPLSISGLGFAYQIETTVEAVVKDSPASKAGLQKGDVIKNVCFYYVNKGARDEPKKGPWFKSDLEAHQWAHIEFIHALQDYHKITLRLERENLVVTMDPEVDLTWPVDDRGLMFVIDYRLQKAHGFGEAFEMGVGRTTRFISQIYSNIRGLASGQIAADQMMGPIAIPQLLFGIAGANIYQFILLLGLISVNLAVVNFLPIPVLDGGHMVFLIYESVRGKPASEGVRVAATYVGLALILSLMLFVIYIDISRQVSG